MATAIKVCRVCGKEYEACYTLRRIEGVFRWQEVACSPECGSVYLARIEASRAHTNANNCEVDTNEEKIIEDVTSDAYGVIDYDEYYDDLDEDDLENDLNEDDEYYE